MEDSRLTKRLESESSAAFQGEKHQLKVSFIFSILSLSHVHMLPPHSHAIQQVPLCLSLSKQAKQDFIIHFSKPLEFTKEKYYYTVVTDRMVGKREMFD